MSLKNVDFFICSFYQGDVFVVDDVIDSDWLWVTAQKNKEKGLVPAALVEDAVSKFLFVACMYMFSLALETKTHTCHKLIHVAIIFFIATCDPLLLV